jgi:hypothetical protein
VVFGKLLEDDEEIDSIKPDADVGAAATAVTPDLDGRILDPFLSRSPARVTDSGDSALLKEANQHGLSDPLV